MIHFEWPWLLATLPLPLLFRWLLPAANTVEQAALKVPFINDFSYAEKPVTSISNQLTLSVAALSLIHI